MANLYEINESIVAAFERGIDAETGEILSEKALEELAKRKRPLKSRKRH